MNWVQSSWLWFLNSKSLSTASIRLSDPCKEPRQHSGLGSTFRSPSDVRIILYSLDLTFGAGNCMGLISTSSRNHRLEFRPHWWLKNYEDGIDSMDWRSPDGEGGIADAYSSPRSGGILVGQFQVCGFGSGIASLNWRFQVSDPGWPV